MNAHRRQELHRWLQAGLELELFTIPPYLTALYSIRDGSNQAAATIIQSVVMEEMLHIILVANLMNAVGAKPCLSPELTATSSDVPWQLDIKHYPSRMPHVAEDFAVGLRRFSKETVETFRKIELPDDVSAAPAPPFRSIGDLYEFIVNCLTALTVELGEQQVFSGDRSRQIDGDRFYYGAGGRVAPVRNLADAKDVIAQVAQQGEGRRFTNDSGNTERFGQPKEVAHYFRFNEIIEERYYDRDGDLDLSPNGPVMPVDWDAVYPMQDDPTLNAPGPHGISELLRDFDDSYRRLLKYLHLGFNGQQDQLGRAVGEMHALKHRAIALMKVPTGSDHRTCGPPFWYVVSRPR